MARVALGRVSFGLVVAATALACEAVPELRFAEAEGGSETPTPEGEVARILDPPGPAAKDGGVDEPDTGSSSAADGAAPQAPYDRVCAAEPDRPYCCSGRVLCAGKANKCPGACPTCASTCAGRVCCILHPSGRVQSCSDDVAECAQAFKES